MIMEYKYSYLWCTFQLQVILLHSGVLAAREVQVAVGNNAELPCSVGISGNYQVMWKDFSGTVLTFNDEIRTNDPRISINKPYQGEWNLVITTVKRSDEGEYTCVINTTPTQEQVVMLTITSPPSIMWSTPNTVAGEGDDVTFVCNSTGSPIPVISWYKYTVAKQRISIDHVGPRLSLYNVTRDDGATYECQADNGVPPKATAQIKLEVQFVPTVQLPSSQVIQQVGKETLLQCIISSNPPADTHWEFKGQVVEGDKYTIHRWEMGVFMEGLALSITKLGADDFGLYTCIASNVKGSDQNTMQVIEAKSDDLRVISKPSSALSVQGQPVQFDCTVVGMSHRNTLTWWFKNELGTNKIFVSNPSSQSDVVYINSDKYEIKGSYNLLVKNITLDDGGEYTCDVSNHGNYSATLTVVDAVSCGENSSIIVDEGTSSSVSCYLGYQGPPVTWQVDWQHGLEKLSSINEDKPDIVRRTVSFVAHEGHIGRYECGISTIVPSMFNGSCYIDVQVIVPEPTARPVCSSSSSTFPVVIVIVGGAFLVLAVCFILVLATYLVRYRKELAQYKAKDLKSQSSDNSSQEGPRTPSARYKNNKNGSVNLETRPLNTAEATPENEMEEKENSQEHSVNL